MDDKNAYLRLERKVNTSVGQFRSAPRYFAHVTGSRELDLGDSGDPVLVDGSRVVLEQGVDSFVMVVYVLKVFLLMYNLQNANMNNLIKSNKLKSKFNEEFSGWQVEWMGVEG